MQILPCQFNNNDTIIVGDYVSIGRQTFRISILDAICDEHGVSDAIKKEILDAHALNNKSVENWDVLRNHENWIIRAIVALHGRFEDLDILINDENWRVRTMLAFQGRAKDLDMLVNDVDRNVRKAVAEQGRLKDLTVLRLDPDPDVRLTVWEILEKLEKLHGNAKYSFWTSQHT